MAKDRRIWIKVATQMPDSPKIAVLSDAAFRAQIEALCYCRDLRTDGFIPKRVALQRWGQEVIDELLANDPDDPSWIVTDRGFEVHDYLAHQESRADIEAREKQAREAGAKGGAKRAANRSAKRAATGSGVANPQAESLAESESESESYIPIKTLSISQVTNAREETLTDDEREAVEAVGRLAAGIGIDLDVVRSQAVKIGRDIDVRKAYRLSMHLLQKAKRQVNNPTGYVVSSFRNEPFEIQKWIDTEVTT